MKAREIREVVQASRRLINGVKGHDEEDMTGSETVSLLLAGSSFAMLGEIAAQLAEANVAKPTLRDHYAMAAMQSVLSSDPAILWEEPDGHKKAMKQIFAWADAMIEARKMQ